MGNTSVVEDMVAMEDDTSTIASDCLSKGSGPIIIASNMPTTIDRLPATLREELRRCIALKGMDVLYKKSSMKVCEQRSFMYDAFHGNRSRGVISMVHQLCAGAEEFAELFEDRTDQVLNRGDEGNTKQLKTKFSRAEKSYLLGKHIDVKSMSETNYKNKTSVGSKC